MALAAALVAAVPVGTFGLVLVSTYVSPGLAWVLGVAVDVAWVAGLVRLLGAAGCWVAAFGAILWLMALGAVTSARDAMVLDASGVTATAWVSAAHDHPQGRHPDSAYDLVDGRGVPVPGGTVYAGLRSHAVGERLTVRYDPRGVVAARLPDDVDVLAEAALALGLNAAMMAATAGLGVSVVRNGRPRRVPFRRGGGDGGGGGGGGGGRGGGPAAPLRGRVRPRR
ncbi:hypothetical protein ACGF07_11565 [Kitasatospora sp. NPDC048194]|uniref:hypothetical protein n=1 Tax=Kitasatospora sp. NPDC048194 TaxID=3364045 RepID=UPI00371893CC